MSYDDWLAIVRGQADDGGAANAPEYGPTTFDEISRAWTQGIVPDEVLRLRAQLLAAQAELARLRPAPELPAKLGIPMRALSAKRQRVGLFLPEGF